MNKGLYLDEAVKLAATAHAGQVYNHPETGPQPYVMHPWRVSQRVSDRAKVVALLHDVKEDSDLALPTVIMKPENVIAIGHLTRQAETPYLDYIRGVALARGKAGDIAREVKVADLRENMSCIRPGHYDNNWDKYKSALRILGSD